MPADRINRSLVEGLPNPHYIHDPSTLSSRCAEAGIGQAEIFIRDWAGRERMILLFRRLPADTGAAACEAGFTGEERSNLQRPGRGEGW